MIVVCSGLIGIGKSSLCRNLCDIRKGHPFFEPVDSNPYLELYYKDKEKYAFQMQVNLLFERYIAMEEAFCRSELGELCVCDRSIYEDWAFAVVQLEEGYMSELDFKTYNKMHTRLLAKTPFPDLILYLKGSVDTSMERIKERERTCECGIPREYLEHLNRAYERLMPRISMKCPVVEIDAERNAAGVLCQSLEAIQKRELEIDKMQPCYHGGF